MEEAVVSSVQDWYNFILDKMPIESNRAMRVKNLTNLTNILGQDLREGCNASHDQFQASLNVNYKQLCFRQYLTKRMMTSFHCLQRTILLAQICTEESFDLSYIIESFHLRHKGCHFSLSFAGLTSASWWSSVVTS